MVGLQRRHRCHSLGSPGRRPAARPVVKLLAVKPEQNTRGPARTACGAASASIGSGPSGSRSTCRSSFEVAGERNGVEIEADAAERERIPYLDGRACGRIGREILAPDQLELVEIFRRGEMHLGLEDAIERCLVLLEYRLECFKAVPGLRRDQGRSGLAKQFIGGDRVSVRIHRIDRGREHVVAGAHRFRGRSERHRAASLQRDASSHGRRSSTSLVREEIERRTGQPRGLAENATWRGESADLSWCADRPCRSVPSRWQIRVPCARAAVAGLRRTPQSWRSSCARAPAASGEPSMFRPPGDR